jgi:dUTP pyrophosphatase
VILTYKKLVSTARDPERAHSSDAGWDLRSLVELTLQPGAQETVPTGLAIQMRTVGEDEFRLYHLQIGQLSWYGRIAEKSGLASKHGIHVVGGVIDRNYTGEIKVVLANLGFFLEGKLAQMPFKINPGDKIAQYVPTVIPRVLAAEETQELFQTDRGGGGFGSTGT